MKDSIRVFAPATVANVACGFDILGFALNEPGDQLLLRKTAKPGVRITKITGDEGKLPYEVRKNTAGLAVELLLEHCEQTGLGIEVEVHKKMPLGSGLGSSAASAAAALFGANELLGRPLSREEMLPFAMESERMACGSAHGDNVAPALLGGFVLVRAYDPPDFVTLDFPEELTAVLIRPHIEIKTADARGILRMEVKLKDAVTQWGNVAGLVAGLLKKDYALISGSLKDVIIEPVRSLLIPVFDEMKGAALENGALGCSISGSGPSVFALCRGRETAEKVGKAMEKQLSEAGIGSDLFVSSVNRQGPIILD